MNWRTGWQFCSLQQFLEVGNCFYTQFRENKSSGVNYLVQYCSGCLVMQPCRHHVSWFAHLSVYVHGFILIFCLIFNYAGILPVSSDQLTNESCTFLVTLQTWCCLGCLGSHCFTWSKKAPDLSDYSWIHKDKLKATKNLMSWILPWFIFLCLCIVWLRVSYCVLSR